MNPTKEELDKAIEYYEDMLNQNVPLDMEERTALTILTRYRDGELVEKADQKDLLLNFLRWYDKLTPSQKCTVHPPAGSGASSGIFDKTDGAIVDLFLTTPPTNQTEKS